mmetsp:Transcript_27342/g.56201  ORF Transcript_27342/g.56201 Transcript_27342/m.56201 type:complete len:89 (-) Transcript_27342:143-409(-)|eukprot:CAMPEP_0182546894 /NCGR_PEP_ID=MMETSP1323-20130603/36691_1 /TAXON_ID=236787 /ORGANISM="Florenciella parvula, Strain RCC1693" /LENGTH=88 /DNA_ID=CAMNT_0024758159 /DNA_START=258 /DNA_END=524 /DNA_ORIENTATION=+
MSWGGDNWEDDVAVEKLMEVERKEREDKGVDDEGYKLISFKERIYRGVAMLVFAVVFPFVFVFLGIYRGVSLLSDMGSSRPKATEHTE